MSKFMKLYKHFFYHTKINSISHDWHEVGNYEKLQYLTSNYVLSKDSSSKLISESFQKHFEIYLVWNFQLWSLDYVHMNFTQIFPMISHFHDSLFDVILAKSDTS